MKFWNYGIQITNYGKSLKRKELLISRIRKPNIFYKLLKSLERNEKCKPSKRRINKVISLLTCEEFQILPQNVVKRKQIIAEIKTSSNQPNVTFSINKYHFMGIAYCSGQAQRKRQDNSIIHNSKSVRAQLPKFKICNFTKCKCIVT